MKKPVLFSIALFLSVFTSYAQWTWQNPLPQGNSLKSVFFTDINTGYAVGDSGTIIKTINGGATWTIQASGTTNSLNTIGFFNANAGYAMGYGILLKTTNGGGTWTAIPLVQGIGGSGYFTDANIGYNVRNDQAFGLHGIISKTIDGGNNWTESWIWKQLFSIYFPTANTGYIVGASGTILKTINAGTTWTDQSVQATNDLSSVFFMDTITGYSVGKGGTILKTQNGGISWTPLMSGTIANLLSAYFPNSNIGYVVGEFGTILKTIDGGTTWTSQSIDTNKVLCSVYFPGTETGYIVGDKGTILKTTNGGYGLGFDEKQPANIMKNRLKIYPNPVTDKITVEPSDSGTVMNATVTVYGMTGRGLIKQQVQGSELVLNVSFLPKGIYFIRVGTNEKIEIGKFVKE